MILVLPVYHACDFEGSLVGLGSAGGEEEFVEACGQDFEQLGAQLGTRGCCVTRCDVGQFARLLRDRFNDARIFVAEIDAHQLRAEVEIALACAVGEPAAFGIGDIERLPGLLESPCAVVGLAGDVDDLFGRKLGCSRRVAHE